MEVCRLCLKIILDSSYHFVDDANETTNREKIAIFLPQMDIDVVVLPVLCILCADFLQEVYNFKQTCLQTEQKLKNYIQMNNCNGSINLLNIINKTDSKNVVKSEGNDDVYENEDVEEEITIRTEKAEDNTRENSDESSAGQTNKSFIGINEKIIKNEATNLFHCRGCKKNFETNEALLHHNLVSLHERNYLCKTCRKRFCSARNLKEHMKHHASNKPFQCRYCDNSFVYKATLLNHELIHTGERPFHCETCGKSFRQSAALTTHIRCVHNTEKAFLCNICQKKFSVRSLLNLHMKRHIGSSEKVHKCAYCPKSFYTRSALTTHTLWHTKEKSHICIVCCKGFIGNSFLKRHMRTHTGEKPYECNLCDFKCTQKYNLTVHISSHYKNKNE